MAQYVQELDLLLELLLRHEVSSLVWDHPVSDFGYVSKWMMNH
jgi:hypothetical protein